MSLDNMKYRTMATAQNTHCKMAATFLLADTCVAGAHASAHNATGILPLAATAPHNATGILPLAARAPNSSVVWWWSDLNL